MKEAMNVAEKLEAQHPNGWWGSDGQHYHWLVYMGIGIEVMRVIQITADLVTDTRRQEIWADYTPCPQNAGEYPRRIEGERCVR